jgi:hypothetical protein
LYPESSLLYLANSFFTFLGRFFDTTYWYGISVFYDTVSTSTYSLLALQSANVATHEWTDQSSYQSPDITADQSANVATHEWTDQSSYKSLDVAADQSADIAIVLPPVRYGTVRYGTVRYGTGLFTM